MSDIQDKNINQLLEQLKSSRDEIEEDLKSVRSSKDKITNIFPKDLDHKHKYFLEDKIRIVNSFYDILLKYRQEINQTLMREVEIRNRINQQEESNEDEEERDRKLIQKLEQEGVISYGDSKGQSESSDDE